MTSHVKTDPQRKLSETCGAAAAATVAVPCVRRVDAAEVLYINTWGGRLGGGRQGEPSSTPSPRKPASRSAPFRRSRSPSSQRRPRPASTSSTSPRSAAATSCAPTMPGIIEPITDKMAADMSLWPGAVFQNGVASHAFADHDRLPQGQVPERRPEELGRVLGREEIPRPAQPAALCRAHPADRAAGRRRADRQGSIRSISTAPSSRSTASSRMFGCGGRRARSRSSCCATARLT